MLRAHLFATETGLVPRARQIRYGGVLQDGGEFAFDATGFHARVFQHEFDHLNGVLYPQRITDMTKVGFIEAMTHFTNNAP